MATDSSATQGPTAVAISVVFAVITFIVISLRLFSRIVVVRSVGLDDMLMTAAAVLSWVFIALTILAVNHGLGAHLDAVEEKGPANFITYAKIVWLSSIFYNACLGFIKVSVLCLYMRLGDLVLRRLSIFLAGVIVCQALANVLTCIFQCNPVPGAWDVSLDPKCIDINTFYLTNAALNIATDLATYALPIRMVLNLQTPTKQKLAVAVMFGLGFFACISSVVRISFVPEMLTSSDPTWAIARPMYWSVIETNVGILAASIPSFKPIARRYSPGLLGEYSSGRSYPGLSSNRRDFDKMSAGGGGDEPITLNSMYGKDGITTTIRASQMEGGRSDMGDISKSSSGSEQSLVINNHGRITQSTHITQKVEPSWQQ